MVSSRFFEKLGNHSGTGIDLIMNSPGRFYASRLLKLIIAHMLENYEIKTDAEAKQETQRFYWRSAIVPKSSVVVQLRKRV